jgi:glycine cleavage system H protein
MIALLVVLTFLAGILLDHFLTRQPIVLLSEETGAAPEPRLVPSFVSGFAVPDNLRYHPGHPWAVAESREQVRVGIDDLAAKVAGTVTSINVPSRGQWIRQGQRIISMTREGGSIDLVSPIEGTVVGVNEAALANPEIARKDPYGEGWLLTVNVPDAVTNFRNLLSGATARRWMEEAAARLRNAAPMAVGAVAQDGGVALDSAIGHLSPQELQKLEKDLFLV